MESALAWIGHIADWLGQWIPRWVILDTTQGGIKFVGGSQVRVCGPGVHFYWPARTTLVVYPTARQTDRLSTQTMESADGRTFIVEGTITYCVENLELLIPTTHSPTTTVVDIAMTVVHDVCCDMEWAELQAEQRKRTIKTKLRNAVQKELSEYGIKVLMLKLNTLARCRVLKISQSMSNEEN
jgi:regulator of protease activity HflC (stomatin/prohibitin superfamily)